MLIKNVELQGGPKKRKPTFGGYFEIFTGGN